ncbi:hypothetical protein BGW42_005427 [Actinomortierella wolfii]|nr:hypothetical protein BGW42_005427 [Actinomortierella wolfii]
MDLTNALHSTVGLTDGIFYLEQKSASRRIPYNTANFEVHFSNREGNAEEARERALTIPITLNGIQYVASEPVEQHLEVHRILVRNVKCTSTQEDRMILCEVFKRLFFKIWDHCQDRAGTTSGSPTPQRILGSGFLLPTSTRCTRPTHLSYDLQNPRMAQLDHLLLAGTPFMPTMPRMGSLYSRLPQLEGRSMPLLQLYRSYPKRLRGEKGGHASTTATTLLGTRDSGRGGTPASP